VLLDELADAQLAGTPKDCHRHVPTVPLLVPDDLGMKRLPHTAAEELLDIVTRRYERASTLITWNRPVEDWASSSATPRPSPRCSTASSTTPNVLTC
jgi:DNA replication protein DnaC